MPADLTSFKAREVTRALQLIHRIWFEEMGREYWIRHGTLLGAFRHQGFIPGDNDGDVTLLGGELDTRETIRLMDARLFEMDRRFVIREDNPRHAQVISLRRWLPVAGRGLWSKYRWSRHHLIDILFEPPGSMEVGLCSFNDITLLAPRDPLPFLTTTYGDNFMIPDRPLS